MTSRPSRSVALALGTASVVAASLEGMTGYPGIGTGAWRAGSAGGCTVVLWDEAATGPAGDAWAAVMRLAQAFGWHRLTHAGS